MCCCSVVFGGVVIPSEIVRLDFLKFDSHGSQSERVCVKNGHKLGEVDLLRQAGAKWDRFGAYYHCHC